ncbi:MAG: cell envelope integrity protein TolA [Flavobacteriales bacterium]|nr:cell envelope integrity protein TolA [Flavobacteriales bacterium]
MLKYLGVFVLSLVFSQGIFSQEVSGFHDIEPGSEPNEYIIKTVVTGLEGVDIAKITYVIDSKHAYKVSSSNAFFSDRNESYIKFYIMAVPASGELLIELGIVMVDGGDYAFPVEFQYSKNEEKVVINFPPLIFKSDEVIALLEDPIIEDLNEVDEKLEEERKEELQQKINKEEAKEKLDLENAELEAKIKKVRELAEKEEQLAKEKQLAETKRKEVAEAKRVKEEEIAETEKEALQQKINEEKLREEQLAKIKKEEVQLAKEKTGLTIKYTVQILSLSNYSFSRLKNYCSKHNLDVNDVKKKQVGNVMKITYGEVYTIDEANLLKDKLREEHDVNGFVTKVK